MTTKRLYVGNLAQETTAEEVHTAFARYGQVISVKLAEDRHSGRPRGFAYVEMEDGDAAAIAGLNRTDLRGQPLTVCGALPRAPSPAPRLLNVGGARWAAPPVTVEEVAERRRSQYEPKGTSASGK